MTCRYLPGGTPADQATVLPLPLPDLKEHDFQKFLRRDPTVDDRIRRGELAADLLSDLYHKLGGTPGFLENVRLVLRSADPNELGEDLRGEAPGALSEERERYYQKIFATRLYGALSPQARCLASRLAVSKLPLPVDAVIRIAALPEGTAHDQVRPHINQCVAFGLLQEFTEADLPPLYHPPGLLRPWLAAPERLSPADADWVHGELAVFWRECYEADREAELRVRIDVELLACCEHARLGKDAQTFRWATVQLARRLERRAEWRAARELLEEILETDRDADCLMALASVEESLGDWKLARIHLEQTLAGLPDGTRDKATTWHQLATIDLHEGNYGPAREKFEKALRINQAIGDRAGEAATWHQLASIDVHEGNYGPAREKFEKALRINQAIGDRAGEAATWHQLASIDIHEGNYGPAREKFEKALAMRQSIGDRAGEAATWHNLASIDLHEGNYGPAREKFEKALAMRQAIGDRAGEAATWHQFATIDLNEGNYGPAREKFEKSLRIMQAIGDRAGEAATFFQLGILAHRMGRGHVGARLVAICWMIDRDIGHGDAERDFRALSSLCSELSYEQRQFDEMLKEAAAAYQADRGHSLIKRAFAVSGEGGKDPGIDGRE